MLKEALSTLKEGEMPIIHSDMGFLYRINSWIEIISRTKLIQ